MKPTEQLRHEHEAIKLVLAVLAKLSSRLSSTAKISSADVDGVLEFITVFCDRCHHGKEEGFLFPVLTGTLPNVGAPVTVMLYEHEQGRGLVKEMVESWRRYQTGDKGAARKFTEAANRYIDLLTEMS